MDGIVPSNGLAIGPGIDVRHLAGPTLLGVALALAVLGGLLAVGRLVGREPAIPWVCEDTRHVDTVPRGRAVVGPSVSAPPGCGV